MTQAVLEGVAFAIKDCVEIARAQGVEIASSTLCGGGAKEPAVARDHGKYSGHSPGAAPD